MKNSSHEKKSKIFNGASKGISSPIIILIVAIVVAVAGGIVIWQSRQAPGAPSPTPTPAVISTPSSSPSPKLTPSVTPTTYVRNRIVYYVNERGEEKIIAKSSVLTGLIKSPDDFIYDEAILSPNKRFILLKGGAWEMGFFDVYSIKEEKIHTGMSSEGMVADFNVNWLSNNQLTVVRVDADGRRCVFKSVDAEYPWNLKSETGCLGGE